MHGGRRWFSFLVTCCLLGQVSQAADRQLIDVRFYRFRSEASSRKDPYKFQITTVRKKTSFLRKFEEEDE